MCFEEHRVTQFRLMEQHKWLVICIYILKRRCFCLCSWNFFWKVMLIWSKWSPLILEQPIAWGSYFKNPWEGHWSCFFSLLHRLTLCLSKEGARRVHFESILVTSGPSTGQHSNSSHLLCPFPQHGSLCGGFLSSCLFLIGKTYLLLWDFIPQITYLLLLPAPEHGCLVIPHCGITLLSQLSIHNKQSVSFPWW